jgi:hypothetical protein
MQDGGALGRIEEMHADDGRTGRAFYRAGSPHSATRAPIEGRKPLVGAATRVFPASAWRGAAA